MKKAVGIIICLIMMFSIAGCMHNNANSLPINPGGSNSETDTAVEPKEDESGNSAETKEDDESSSHEKENQPPKGTDNWTGFY